MTIDELLHVLLVKMEANSNGDKSEQMSAYMKHQFVFLGIQSPARTTIQRKWFADVKSSGVDRWEIIDALWDMEQREYQYVAIDLLKRIPKKEIEKDDIHAIKHLITTKSWWDTVDLIASNYLGAYFQKFPEMRDSVVDAWRNDEDIWLNRSCLLFQLKYKDQTNFKLLKSLIRQYQHNDEFFIQKAIGWSLRQYSKTNPDAVRLFINEIGLQGLARREGSKYL